MIFYHGVLANLELLITQVLELEVTTLNHKQHRYLNLFWLMPYQILKKIVCANLSVVLVMQMQVRVYQMQQEEEHSTSVVVLQLMKTFAILKIQNAEREVKVSLKKTKFVLSIR